MKRYLPHLIFLFLLVAVTLYLNQFRRSTTLDGRQMDFAITLPALVSKIIISDNEGMVVLEKDKNGHWVLNSGHEVREKAVEMMLQTLTRIRVTSPAPLSVADDVYKKLQTEGMEVELRIGRRTRKFLIYSESPQSPTYMINHNSSQVFVVEVLGFTGHVASLFVSDQGYWRPNILFNYHLNEIAEVVVEHRDDENSSFRLTQSAGGEFSLYKYSGGGSMDKLNDSLVIRFLANFFYVPYQRFTGGQENATIDSLTGIQPDFSLRVTDYHGTGTDVHLFKILANSDGDDLPEIDPFRLNALINNKSELVVVPYHQVDLLLRPASYFITAED